jgi:unsaturated rhamnogalacturonyl hydrolase
MKRVRTANSADVLEYHRVTNTWRFQLLYLCLCLGGCFNLGAFHTLEVGLTREGRLMDAVVVEPREAAAYRVVLIGALDGDEYSRLSVLSQFRRYEGRKKTGRAYELVAITGVKLAMAKFPPEGRAYLAQPEAQAIWRWLGLHAPDLVLIAGEDYGLAGALSANAVAGVGRIPAKKISPGDRFEKLAAMIEQHSEAWRELHARQARTPLELARALGNTYGHTFRQPTYLEGMALIAQMRLGNLAQVAAVAEPYLTGAAVALPARASTLNFAGHLVFGELAGRTGDQRALELVRKAALMGFENGEMREAMPLHGEMSDAIFMSTSLLTRAGKLTGERQYYDMAWRHLRFMNQLVLRNDGLYRHSPLTDAAWGRGNAFAALGYALALSDWPAEHPFRSRVMADYQELMAALARHQTADGLWRNVVDYRGAYGETSATAMIAFAMERGVRRGWIPAPFYRDRIERAWNAVSARTSSDGVFIDVCESTNKQLTLGDYLNREATFGKDDRAGGMVMMLAAELAGLD